MRLCTVHENPKVGTWDWLVQPRPTSLSLTQNFPMLAMAKIWAMLPCSNWRHHDSMPTAPIPIQIETSSRPAASQCLPNFRTVWPRIQRSCHEPSLAFSVSWWEASASECFNWWRVLGQSRERPRSRKGHFRTNWKHTQNNVRSSDCGIVQLVNDVEAQGSFTRFGESFDVNQACVSVTKKCVPIDHTPTSFHPWLPFVTWLGHHGTRSYTCILRRHVSAGNLIGEQHDARVHACHGVGKIGREGSWDVCDVIRSCVWCTVILLCLI